MSSASSTRSAPHEGSTGSRPARRSATRLPVVFNGKFLSASPTGVHRVAEELIRGVFARCAADPALERTLAPQLWVPSDGAEGARRAGLPHRVVGPLRGIPWEQITLPLRAQGRLLVNLCNVGPVLSTDAVTMFHDAQVHLSPGSYSPGFRAWYRFHQPIAGRRHRRILTVSHFSREQLALHGLVVADRIGVVHNGVDHMDLVEPDAGVLARLQLQPRRYVVALANTQVHKNIGVLLRAFADPRLSGLRLVLFGTADAGAFRDAGHVVPAGVCFAGRVSDAELRALYAQALCMAFPSRTEGFGLPPLEAMTQGCPAVVAPCGALPEVCGDAALYASPDVAADWVRQVSALADDPVLQQRLQDTARAQAAGFTWGEATRQLIDELLAV